MDRACPTDQPAQAVNISAVDRKAQGLADVLVDHKDRAVRQWARVVHRRDPVAASEASEVAATVTAEAE